MTRRVAARCLLAVVAGLALVALGAEARANLCADALGRPQPRLASGDARFDALDRIWRRIYHPFFRATGRKTELVVLADDAQTSAGKPFPAIAMACQRPQTFPAVVVTSPFVALASARGGLDEPFVALIVAHELGHRMHDFDVAGIFKAGADEGRADQRGAFLAAAAGYDTRRVMCEDCIDQYLDAEGVADVARAARRAALPEVVRRFEMWETVYTAASALVFAEPATAGALLSAARSELGRVGESIAEMQLLEAIALMNEAAPKGCWTEAAYTPEYPNDHLRCVPVFAGHTGLAPRRTIDKGLEPTRGCDLAATRKLEKAIEILDSLDPDAVSGLGLATARACVAFYLGETDVAATYAAEAETHLGPDAPAEVRLAVRANRSLIGWLGWWRLAENRMPLPNAAAADLKAWRRTLVEARRDFAGHPELDAWLDTVSGKPVRRRRSGITTPAPRCKALAARESDAVWGDVVLPVMPSGVTEGCPCDWVEWSAFKDPLAPTAAEGRVSVCAPAGDGGTGLSRLVSMHLPMRGVAARAMLYRPLGGPLSDITTWQRRCDALEMVGVADSGLVLWQGSCAAVGADAVTLASDGCTVRVATRVANVEVK